MTVIDDSVFFCFPTPPSFQKNKRGELIDYRLHRHHLDEEQRGQWRWGKAHHHQECDHASKASKERLEG